MTTPETYVGPMMPGLAAALIRVQAELPKLERDRTVEIEKKDGTTYSYSYVTLANLSEVVLPLLARHGLAFTALPGTGSDGKMCIRYRLLHETGESLDGEFPISGDGGIQMIGGRITYARRYCLAALIGVSADEDDEARLAEGDGPRSAQRRAPTTRSNRTRAAAERPTAQRASTSTSPPLPGEDSDPERTPWNDEQRKKMMATFGDIGVGGEADRARRLDLTSRILGRRITSANQLSLAAASRVIEALVSVQDTDDPLGHLDDHYPPLPEPESAP